MPIVACSAAPVPLRVRSRAVSASVRAQLHCVKTPTPDRICLAVVYQLAGPTITRNTVLSLRCVMLHSCCVVWLNFGFVRKIATNPTLGTGDASAYTVTVRSHTVFSASQHSNDFFMVVKI